MTDENKKSIFDREETKEDKPKFSKPAPFETKRTKRGVVANIIVGKRIIVDVSGNGEEIPYNASKHANLKIGDPIEF